jgi:hypothetical protein
MVQRRGRLRTAPRYPRRAHLRDKETNQATTVELTVVTADRPHLDAVDWDDTTKAAHPGDHTDRWETFPPQLRA